MDKAEEIANTLKDKINSGVCSADDIVEALRTYADARLEEAAKIATEWPGNTYMTDCDHNEIGVAIRALKSGGKV